MSYSELWRNSRRRPTLPSGWHIYCGGDGIWRIYRPGDRFIRIQGSREGLTRLQPVLHGKLPLASVVTDDRESAEADRVLEALERQGLLAEPPIEPAIPGGASVHVAGDNSIGTLVAALLRPIVSVTTGPVDAAVVGSSDFVIACAEWLPDARWRRIDQWCLEHSTPWHMCYAEGTRFYLGPCSIPGRTASYADTRARRLAAASSPDELLVHWEYLDQDSCLPSVPSPGPGAVALIAGLLVADALHVLAGEPAPTEAHQLEVDPFQSTIERHPVLPIPRICAGHSADGATT